MLAQFSGIILSVFFFLAAAVLTSVPFVRNRRVRRAVALRVAASPLFRFVSLRNQLRMMRFGGLPVLAGGKGGALKPTWAWASQTQAHQSNGMLNFPMNGLPTQGPGGLARVQRIILDCNYTDIDVDATVGGLDTLGLYNRVASMTLSDGNEAWGPNNLPGPVLASRDYVASGEAQPFGPDINGDAPIPASTNNATRRFQLVYDFSKYGVNGDECTPPSSSFVKNGTLAVKLNTDPSNATFVGTYTLIVEGIFEPKVKAVPRIFTEVMNPFGNETPLGFSGMLLGLDIMGTFQQGKTELPFDGTEFSTITLKADSVSLIDQVDPYAIRSKALTENPEVSGADIQRHFADVIGGTNPYTLPLFPLGPSQGNPIGNQPTADTFMLKLNGAGAFQAMTLVRTYARKLTDAFIGRQWNDCGCGVQTVDAGNKIHDTASKAPLVNNRLDGFLPVLKAGPISAVSTTGAPVVRP